MPETPSLFDPPAPEPEHPTGAELAAEGQAIALDNAGEWRDRARLALLGLVKSGRRFTSEDLVAVVGLPDPNAEGANRNNAVGAMIAHASRAGWVTRVGDVKAQRKALHAARLSVWQGTDEGRRVADVERAAA